MVCKRALCELAVDGTENGELVKVIGIDVLLLGKVVGEERPCTVLAETLGGNGEDGCRMNGSAEPLLVGIADKRNPFTEQTLLRLPEACVIAQIHLIQQGAVVAVAGLHVEIKVLTDLVPVGGFPDAFFRECLCKFKNLDEFRGGEGAGAGFRVNELIAYRCAEGIEEVHARHLTAERVNARLQLCKCCVQLIHRPAVCLADQRGFCRQRADGEGRGDLVQSTVDGKGVQHAFVKIVSGKNGIVFHKEPQIGKQTLGRVVVQRHFLGNLNDVRDLAGNNVVVELRDTAAPVVFLAVVRGVFLYRNAVFLTCAIEVDDRFQHIIVQIQAAVGQHVLLHDLFIGNARHAEQLHGLPLVLILVDERINHTGGRDISVAHVGGIEIGVDPIEQLCFRVGCNVIAAQTDGGLIDDVIGIGCHRAPQIIGYAGGNLHRRTDAAGGCIHVDEPLLVVGGGGIGDINAALARDHRVDVGHIVELDRFCLCNGCIDGIQTGIHGQIYGVAGRLQGIQIQIGLTGIFVKQLIKICLCKDGTAAVCVIERTGLGIDAGLLVVIAGIDGIPCRAVVGKGDKVAVFAVLGIHGRNGDIGGFTGIGIDVVEDVGLIPVFVI